MSDTPDLERASTGRTRKVRADKGQSRKHVMPILPVIGPHKALTEIDLRLAEAIALRGQAVENCAKMEYWQRKVQMLDQEINTLIGYTRQLTGQAPSAPPSSSVDPQEVLRATMPYSFASDVPPTVGSIPATERPRGPRPNSKNAAEEIAGEGGFA